MQYHSPAEAYDLIRPTLAADKVLFMFDSDLTITDRKPPEEAHLAAPPQETKEQLFQMNMIEGVIVSINTGRDATYTDKTYEAPYAGAYSHGQYLRREFGAAIQNAFSDPDFNRLDNALSLLLKAVPDMKLETADEKRVLHIPEHMSEIDQEGMLATIEGLLNDINQDADEPIGVLTGNRVFEIGHAKAGKGPAAEALKQRYPNYKVISGGDSGTDIDMLNQADIAILVGDLIPDDAISGPSTVIRFESPAQTRELISMMHAQIISDPARDPEILAQLIQ